MATYRRNFPWLLHHAPGLTQQSYGSVNDHSQRDIEPSIMEGASIDGKMSNTRRFFIMLTVFDVLFTFLIWIICTIVSGEYTISTAFKNEVLSYSIKSSMFDVVVLAVARLFLIILFYVFIRLSHWWVVAVTTAGTSAFVIAKVFLYQWVHSSKTAAVVLLLCSFVISWGEAWFLDFRVLPTEYKAESILEIQAQQEVVRHPIIFPFPHPPLSRSQSEDGSAFYSPQGSDTDDALYDDTGALSDIEWLSPRSSHNL